MLPRLKNYPTEGAMTIAAGESYVIELGAQSSNFLRVASASASFRIRIDDTYEIAVSAGKKFDTLPNKFSKIEVLNNSGGALTFLLEIGSGSISSDEVVLSGTSNVSDAAVLAALTALDTNMQAALEEVEVEINDLMTLLQNSTAQRAPVHVLGGTAGYGSNSTTAVAIVTPAANTNGMILRTVDGMSSSAGNYSGLFARTTAPAGYYGNTGRISGNSATPTQAKVPLPLYIPAGYGLYYIGSGADAYSGFYVTYDLL